MRVLLAAAVLLGVGVRAAKFKTAGLKRIDLGLQDAKDLKLAAFCDFNSDKLGEDQSRISLYQATAKGAFEAAGEFTLQAGKTIINVIPTDFDWDGRLDLVLVLQDNAIWVVWGDGNTVSLEGRAALQLPAPTHVSSYQPFVADVQGDMKSSLVYYSANFTLSSYTHPDLFLPFVLENHCSVDFAASNQPHSNGMVDIDGDCRADLVVSCPGSDVIFIYLNTVDNGFVFSKSISLPKGAGRVSFTDVNGDGTIDLVFPVCTGHSRTSCRISVRYNLQMPLCGSGVKDCRRISDLCAPDPNYGFGEEVVAARLDPADTFVELEDLYKGTNGILLRVGDVDNDGYPDLIFVTRRGGKSTARLFMNSQGVSDGTRSFSERFDGQLSGVDNVVSAAFLDLYEDGTMDIVLSTKDSGGLFDRDKYETVFLFNNFYNDAFSLKSLVLNGVCPSWCPNGESPEKKPYGVNYAGATIKFAVQDTSGRTKSRIVGQLSQSSYIALQTPYTLFGLGRTNNYIDALHAGVTHRGRGSHVGSFSGMIPNSQLVVIPYQPEGELTTSSWKLELFVNPADYAMMVLLVLVSVMALLGTIVFALYILEKREDEREKRRALHEINFDAL